MQQPRQGSWRLLVLALVICAPGCRQVVQQYTAPLPRMLPPAPTLEQIVQTVNANSAGLQSFSAPRATLSGQGFPTLRASLAFERPRRFRLRAETALTGPELDLGSNDEGFWFWVRRNDPPAVYFCRHAQFASCNARQLVPLDPQWLVEALGVAWLDPALPHQGPYTLPGDRLEIRTIVETPAGAQTRVTVVHAGGGYVVQQSLYDAQGKLLVSADESQHRRDPLTNVIMPSVVAIRSVPFQMSMRLDLGLVEINRGSTSPEMWVFPSYPNAPTIDLATAGPPSR